MKHWITRGVAILCLATTTTINAAEPAAKEGQKPPAEYLIGEMHVQTLPEATLVTGGKVKTTFETLMEPVGKMIPLLSQAIDEGKIRPAGPLMFIYTGLGQDMTKPFDLEIGWCAWDKAKDVGELKVRKLAAFKCATMLYTGPVTKIGKVFEKLMPAVAVANLTPTGETREAYLYWEGPGSANNVIQVQVGIK